MTTRRRRCAPSTEEAFEAGEASDEQAAQPLQEPLEKTVDAQRERNRRASLLTLTDPSPRRIREMFRQPR